MMHKILWKNSRRLLVDLHNVKDTQKLTGPLKLIIVVEVLFLILFVLYILDLIELKTFVTLVVFEMVVGSLFYLLGKRSEARRIKREEERIQKEKLEQEQNKEAERKIKKILTGRLLSEINRNQKLLKPFSDTVVKVLESDDHLSEDIHW
jgi:hypothetical protein